MGNTIGGSVRSLPQQKSCYMTVYVLGMMVYIDEGNLMLLATPSPPCTIRPVHSLLTLATPSFHTDHLLDCFVGCNR